MGGVLAGLKALGPKRLLALGGVGLALLGLLAFLALRAGEPTMAPLFGELEPRDAAAVVTALERQKIPYRLAAGGTQVLAPADQAPRLRLLLAREGLPAGGGVGWEIFDRGESSVGSQLTSPASTIAVRSRALVTRSARTSSGT